MTKYIVYFDSQLLNKLEDAFIAIFSSNHNLLEIWKDEIKIMEFYE